MVLIPKVQAQIFASILKKLAKGVKMMMNARTVLLIVMNMAHVPLKF